MSEEQSGWMRALKYIGIGVASVAAVALALALVFFGFLYLACSGACT